MANVHLVYGSFFMGDSKRDIGMIKSAFPQISGLTVAEPVLGNDFDFNSLKDAKYLIVCTSSQMGMPPPNFIQFARQLLLASQNGDKPLKHLKHAVWGNGDETYFKTYMNMPRYMDLLLEKAGSTRFAARGENGEPYAPLDLENVGCKEWTGHMWKACEAAQSGKGEAVAWDAHWAKQKSEHHQKVTEWDMARLEKHGKGAAWHKPSMFAKL
jgi:sulfite reductase alpha subunit-like flavoprotein